MPNICTLVDNGKFCCKNKDKMKYINGEMMCINEKGNYTALYEQFQDKYDFNPFHHTPFIRLVMSVMYIVLVICAGILIWHSIQYNYLLLQYGSKLLYIIWTCAIILGVVGSISVIYMFSKGVSNRIDKGLFDAWSFGHLMRDILIVLVLYYFMIPLWLCIVLQLSFAISYELFEKYVITKYWYNFGAEDNLNQFSDVIVASIGCVIAYVIIIFI